MKRPMEPFALLLCLALPSLTNAWAPSSAIRIGCVGDSITAGFTSSDAAHSYPGQLQALLDEKHGQGAYNVTNLGAIGATMLKDADKPYWKQPQYEALTEGKWDIVTIMLGTNDAKNGWQPWRLNNWPRDCGGPDHASLDNCAFAADYKAMINVIKTLGTTSAGPKIYVMIPVPLMKHGDYGMNDTVINSVYPQLVPLIQKDNEGVLGPIDLYSQMGGVPDWKTTFPKSCTLDSTWGPCKWYCDEQSCNQCHPNDVGYARMAELLQAGLDLDADSPVLV